MALLYKQIVVYSNEKLMKRPDYPRNIFAEASTIYNNT